MLVQKNTPQRRAHPLYTKKNINQLPQNAYFQTMKENMVNHFFFYFIHVALIPNLLTRFELI